MQSYLTARLLRAGVTVLALVAIGCSFLDPQPDRSRFFVLTAAGQPQAEEIAGDEPPRAADKPHGEQLVIGLGPVKFPDYLDRAQFVVRLGPNQVRLSDTERWAEPLERNFVRVISQNLSGLLGTQQVYTFPWFTSAALDYEVPIDILQFDSDTRGQARLRVRWSVRDVARKQLVISSESDFQEPPSGSGTDAAVAALSKVAADLSAEIARAIRRHGAQ